MQGLWYSRYSTVDRDDAVGGSACFCGLLADWCRTRRPA